MAVFDKASLVMIPSQYKEGKIYNIKPEDQSSSFEFERGSAATRVNSSGLIETFYDEATNSLLQSNQFDTTWNTTDLDTPTNGFAGYDGSNDAWLLNSTTTGFPRIEQSVTLSGVQTFSIYAKSATDSFIQARTFGAVSEVWFNLSTGVASTSSGAGYISSQTEDIGSGWYRCSLTVNGSLTSLRVYPASAIGTYSTSGNGVYIQDAQLESGYFATPYIETTTEAVTRPNRHDTPRLDYSGTEPALLLEPQRTNLITESNNFSSWTQANSTVTQGNVSLPTTSNSWSLVDDDNQGYHQVYKTFTPTANLDYSLSIFVKPVNATQCTLAFGGGGYGGNRSVFYSLVGDGSISTQQANIDNSSITKIGEWYKITLSTNIGSGSGTTFMQLMPTVNGQQAYTGNNQEMILFGDIQLEQGSYATSYIPTNGQTETRLKDVCYGGGYESLFNQTEGTLFIDLEKLAESTPEYHILSLFGDAQNYLWLGMNNNFNRFYVALVVNGTPVFSSTGIDIGTSRGKVAIKYKSGDSKAYANGVNVYNNTSTFSFTTTLKELRFNYSNVPTSLNSTMKAMGVVYFPEALTDTELQQLTTI